MQGLSISRIFLFSLVLSVIMACDTSNIPTGGTGTTQKTWSAVETPFAINDMSITQIKMGADASGNHSIVLYQYAQRWRADSYNNGSWVGVSDYTFNSNSCKHTYYGSNDTISTSHYYINGNSDSIGVCATSTASGDELNIVQYSLASGWGAPENAVAADAANPGNRSTAAVAENKVGDIMMVWIERPSGAGASQLKSRRKTNGIWGNVVTIGDSNSYGNNDSTGLDLHLEMDQNERGDVIAAYHRYYGTFSYNGLTYACFSVHGMYYDHLTGWSTIHKLDDRVCNVFEDIYRKPINVKIADNGNATIVWYDGDKASIDVNHYFYNTGWGSVQTLSFSPNTPNPTLAGDKNGNFAVTWTEAAQVNVPSSVQTVWVDYFDASLGWQSPQQLSDDTGDSSNARIGFDDQGNALFVWAQMNTSTNSPEIRYRWINKTTGPDAQGTIEAFSPDLLNQTSPMMEISTTDSGDAMVFVATSYTNGKALVSMYK